MSRALFEARSRLAVFALFLLSACGSGEPYRQESFVFGTRVEVAVQGVERGRAREAIGSVLREFDRLHRMLHAWQPSELTRLNDAIGRGERSIPVPDELARILAHAAGIAQTSDHLFEPAIGRLVRLWGFHGETFEPRLPPAADIAAVLRARPRMSDLTIAQGRVESRNRQVMIDLGGYAKGYALDRAAVILRQQGITNALINIGGNVMALGTKAGKPWRVGIQNPRAAGTFASLDLFDGEAIGTSGDYQRFFELGGRRYSHLIDPRSGAPAQGVQAVTVLVGPGEAAGALSDAASKPLFIAAEGEWRALAHRLGVERALRIDASGKITLTRALARRVHFGAGNPAVEIVE
ncbi:MAG: FAD:protein FMN transferase [Rhodocyclaceae bacterium]